VYLVEHSVNLAYVMQGGELENIWPEIVYAC